MIDWDLHKSETNLPTYLGGGSLILDNLGSINIIFGPNGSGKSQLMRALSGDSPEDHHLISPERPGDFQYNPSYASEEEIGSSRQSTRLQNITLDYRQRVFSRLSVVLKIRGTLKSPPPDTHYDVASEFLSIIIPEFTLKYVGQQNKDFAIFRSTGEEVSANSLSSGEADLISVGLDMVAICLLWKLKDRSNSVLFLDEPNVHLHPDLDAKLALGIQYLVEKFNVRFFISSHSTSLLSSIISISNDEVRLFYMKKGSGLIRGVKPDPQLKVMSSIMGGSTVLGGVFGLKMVLVEGDDDFEIWNQATRSSSDLKLSVMPPSGGKPRQTRDRRMMVGLFEAMGNSNALGYVLQDRDERTGQPRRNTAEQKMPMLWLGCREAENLSLCNEVLNELGFDTEAARQEISNHGIPTARVNQIFANRKFIKISKDEMIKIQAALFHHNSRWQSMVGKIIGRARPTGELEDFIGETVMSAFWP